MDSPEITKELTLRRVASRDEMTQTPSSNDRQSSVVIPESLFGSLILSIKSKLFGEESSLSWFASTMIMVSLSYGSAVVILPYTLAQLGPMLWTVYTAAIIATLAFCTTLLKDCCVFVMNDRKDYGMLRHPYPTIASLVVSETFGKVVHVFLYIGLVSMALAFSLLGATVMNNIIPLPFSYYNNIRVWIVVVFLVSFPLMMVGTYSNLQTPAVIAVVTSTISMVCIIILCAIAHYEYSLEIATFVKKESVERDGFFIIFGDITFAAAGPALALPNIIVFIKTPGKFHYSIIASHTMIFFIYVLCAVIPYVVFGEKVTPSITDTLNNFLHNYTKNTCSPCWTALAICQVCMTVHFILVAVLSLNPVLLSLENHFHLELEFSWKRFFLRSTVLITLLIFCVLVPYFSPILSLVGGVPQTLLTVVFPIIIYSKLFEMSPYTRVFLIILAILAGVLIIGNIIFSGIQLVLAVRGSM